jgi:hypothetical protein
MAGPTPRAIATEARASSPRPGEPGRSPTGNGRRFRSHPAPLPSQPRAPLLSLTTELLRCRRVTSLGERHVANRSAYPRPEGAPTQDHSFRRPRAAENPPHSLHRGGRRGSGTASATAASSASHRTTRRGRTIDRRAVNASRSREKRPSGAFRRRAHCSFSLQFVLTSSPAWTGANFT